MDNDAIIKRIQEHCLAKPEAYEDHPWGDTVYKVGPKGKIFCFSGHDNPVISVKATVEEQSALIQHPNIEVAAYVGRYGWVTVYLRDADTLELAMDLIDRSYEAIAPKKKAKKALS
jgi:predicted DNA-binding protein (MmcQ/YjbR family)